MAVGRVLLCSLALLATMLALPGGAVHDSKQWCGGSGLPLIGAASCLLECPDDERCTAFIQGRSTVETRMECYVQGGLTAIGTLESCEGWSSTFLNGEYIECRVANVMGIKTTPVTVDCWLYY